MSRLKRADSRGSLIIAALMLFAVLLALGLGLMSSQSARMRVAEGQANAVKAKALCESAWEDVRMKLGKDILFPSLIDGQTFFAYSEDVYDEDDEMVGSYTVVIDTTVGQVTRQYDGLDLDTEVAVPRGIYQITCIGKVGERAQVPLAERVMNYEIVMANTSEPARSFEVIRVIDQGSI